MKTGIRLSYAKEIFREMSSLRVATVLRFVIDSMDIYGIPCVEFKIMWMADHGTFLETFHLISLRFS